ncbi:phosphoglycerate kinase [Patescibacteria group bacterium]|nr:phosphoglycerate kinase [Patescibacteria group bacterium]
MKTVTEIAVEGKRVLLRTDYDVPLKDGKVADDTRIKASLPTINALLDRRAKAITILCHINRPGGKVVESLRVKPVAEHLSSLLPEGAPLNVEENLRFNPREKENNLDFAKELAEKGDVFVNDAFAVSHREHASIVSLPKLLPSSIGLHFEEELNALDKVRQNPRRPVIFVIGGAKLETKLPIIEKIVNIADEILVGGKIAQEVGNTCSPEALACMTVAQLAEDGKDITGESAGTFARKISKAGTIVWNGPMGVYEEDAHSKGSRIIAQAVNAAPGYTVIGGGDTEAAATKFDAEDGIDHISMGGGAMLQYLTEGTLVGLEAIKESKQ